MQRFKPGQVYYNPASKSTLLILSFPKVRRIAHRRGLPSRDMEISERAAKKLVLIGNNYTSIAQVDVMTMSDTDPQHAVVKTMAANTFKSDVTAVPFVPGEFGGAHLGVVPRDNGEISSAIKTSDPAPLCEREDSHGRSEYQKELACGSVDPYDRGLCPNNDTRPWDMFSKFTTCYAPPEGEVGSSPLDPKIGNIRVESPLSRAIEEAGTKFIDIRVAVMPDAPHAARSDDNAPVRPMTVAESYEEMRDTIRQHTLALNECQQFLYDLIVDGPNGKHKNIARGLYQQVRESLLFAKK